MIITFGNDFIQLICSFVGFNVDFTTDQKKSPNCIIDFQFDKFVQKSIFVCKFFYFFRFRFREPAKAQVKQWESIENLNNLNVFIFGIILKNVVNLEGFLIAMTFAPLFQNEN